MDLIVLRTIIAGSGAMFGLFLFISPIKAIDMERKFYERRNWRLEPISMKKALLNIKVMGLILMIAVVLINYYY